jgi:hypothetical protein
MIVKGENQSTRNIPVKLDLKSNPELRREKPTCAALGSCSSKPGTFIIVRDTAPKIASPIYSDMQQCIHQE